MTTEENVGFVEFLGMKFEEIKIGDIFNGLIFIS
jgi:hypothetical protein